MPCFQAALVVFPTLEHFDSNYRKINILPQFRREIGVSARHMRFRETG